jgi:very-short-patch-repair endonuclease
MQPEHVLRDHAETHLGLALVRDYYTAGGTRHSLRRLLERGDWVRWTRRLLRLRGAPVTDEQTALAAVLDAEPRAAAALSHESGAALFGTPGFFLLPAHVTMRQQPSHKRRLEIGLAHWAALFTDEFRTTYRGIPVVTPPFLALQLFGTLHPDRARRAVSHLLMARLVDKASLGRVLEVEAVQGRNGIVLLREFIEKDASRSVPAETGLELRYEALLERAGEKKMRRQVNVGSSTRWLGRIDEVDEELPLIVQLDSTRYHGALIDQEEDERQRRALEEAGYLVKRFTDEDCFHRPDDVVRGVREARELLRRRQAS